ncbi:MAG: TOBE domain-containing protein [Leptothrix sp. (in: b-proteobacteria)]
MSTHPADGRSLPSTAATGPATTPATTPATAPATAPATTPATTPPADALALQGEIWLTVHGRPLGGHDRMALLRAIAQTGSITHGARAVGLSYKAAWDAVDTMNHLAGEPLLARSAGGRGGGSTQLTPRGLQLVARYEQVEALHRRFVHLLSNEAVDLAHDLSVLRTLNMKTSARNQFLGVVSAIRAGAVNDEVELTLPGGARLVAVVTRESTESLGLRLRGEAIALVQSGAVLLATGLEGTRLSARNQWPGVISAITPGAVNAEVVLDIAGGARIAAIVTQASVAELGLAIGVEAHACFKASSVILAVTV